MIKAQPVRLRLFYCLDPLFPICSNVLTSYYFGLTVKTSTMKQPTPLSARSSLVAALIFALLFINTTVTAAPPVQTDQYMLQPGDVLLVSVWKEEDLTKEVIVRPDGRITFPLVGEANAAGNSIESVRAVISEKLEKYIPDPVVTVSISQLTGNQIYVIGQVNRPGMFPILRNVDVMQALSMAGGTSTYAALNDIKILRRENGELRAMSFKYAEVEKGKRLEQNILLKAGDVVVVP